jgi:gliding motility-associated-like protein
MFQIRALLIFTVLFQFSTPLFSQRGKNGSFTVATTPYIMNTYTTVTTDVAAGSTIIPVTNSAMTGGFFGVTGLSSGDLIMIIQMRGASINVNTTPTVSWGGNYTWPNEWINSTVPVGTQPWIWGEITNYNNVGKYELVEVRNVNVAGTNIQLNCPLQNGYIAAGKVQVVRVPRFVNLTINTGINIEAASWDGATGGVVAVEVNGNLVLNGTSKISATGKGFRGAVADNVGFGGTNNVHTNGTGNGSTAVGSSATGEGGRKGEGIAGFTTEYNVAPILSPFGRGAAANGGGGGGYNNTGGGGGCNVGNTNAYTGKGTPSTAYTATWNLETAGLGGSTSPGGGRGGYSYANSNQNELTIGPNQTAWLGDSRKENGGFGGHPLAYDATRLFMGGGGGAGDQNDGQGGGGGNGGGIVHITCYGTVSGTGTIEADGAAGQNSNPLNQPVTTSATIKGRDGAGGGGGGGMIYVKNSTALPAAIVMNARGGVGGNQALSYLFPPTTQEAGGPGGGGGGGGIVFTSGTPTQSVAGGNAGTTNSTSVNNFPVNGATGGSAGIANLSSTIFNITAANTTICSGQTATLTATVTGVLPGALTWYSVQFGGVALATGSTYTTPALTTTTTYYVGVCPGTFRVPVTVTVNQPTAATFAQIPAVCAGGTFTLPTTSSNGFAGTWSPAVNTNTTTTYTFTPTANQCATGTTMTVSITPKTEPTFSAVGPFCQGASFTLPTTSSNSIVGTWSPAINNQQTTQYMFTPNAPQCADTMLFTVAISTPVVPTFNQVSPVCNGGVITLPTTSIENIQGTWGPAVNNTQTTTYTFTPNAGACATNTATMTVTVNQPASALFNPIAPICSGGVVSLPATSTQGFAGTWSPAPNNLATTTYTFTPNAGQCASPGQATVSVGAPLAATFNAATAVCQGGTISLPASSNEGFTGTWSPVPNNQVTTNYTFTPTAGQCATSGQLTVPISQPVTPLFDPIAAICSGASLSLPSSSTNGINGTWNPPVNNTQTTTYTFTPVATACASTQTLSVTVNPIVTPTFNTISPVCAGTSFSLPAASLEAIPGSWSPAVNTSQTTLYTFSPNAGLCASNTSTLTVTINQPVNPTFPAYGPFCQDAILPQVMLPTTSNNGINGTWNPGMLSTAVAGNIQYIFTPNTSECANSFTLNVQVNQNSTPTFNAIAPICIGGSFTLPASSLEGIAGTWLPPINNTQTTSYTFTPSGGVCANSTSLSVAVNSPVTPTFTPIAPICSGESFSLPSASIESISGTWSPAVNATATTTYTFTPVQSSCANSSNLTVVVNQPIVPSFDPIDPVCSGGNVLLPTTSTNAVVGSWSPAINNAATTTYLFTPGPNQCALTESITVAINENPIIDASNAQVVNESCDQNNGSIIGIVVNGGAPAYTYEWNNTPSINTLDIVSLQAGTYSLIVSDINGCQDTETISVTDIPGPSIDSSNLQVLQPTCIQLGQIQGLTVSGSPTISFSWSGTAVQTLDVTGLEPGSYSLTVTDGNGCTVDFGPITMVAPNPPTASFEFSPFEPSTGETVNFINTSLGTAPLSYLWNIDNQLTQTENTSYIFSEEGAYTVQLNVIDGNGCVDSTSVLITVYGQLIIPNVITANGDNINDAFVIEGLKSNSLLQIFNRWGELVFETIDYQNDWKGIDRSGLELIEGVYTYLLQTAEGEVKHGFIHLER